jgi:hypothetical protein
MERVETGEGRLRSRLLAERKGVRSGEEEREGINNEERREKKMGEIVSFMYYIYIYIYKKTR